jgi:drug/metabolite transporter (DMT)-like permease
MIGIILALLATLFLEVSTVIGKTEVKFKKESVYTFGFLALFWSSAWFLFVILFRDGWSFSPASTPTLFLRVALEFVAAELAIRAIITADRSAHAFVRTITIPLLLIVDLILGYSISTLQIVGIIIIISTVAIGFYLHEISRRGLTLVASSAVIATATISLYKYNITHFNSIATEQFIVMLALLLYFLLMARRFEKLNPFRLLTQKPFALQSITHGFAGVLSSFAFLFAPATIIIAAERSLTILWSILSGNLYFKEKHLVFKMLIFVALSVGVYLLL